MPRKLKNTETINMAKIDKLGHYINYKLPSVAGWCPATKAKDIAIIVKYEEPKIALEIGVFGGRALFAMALAMDSLEGERKTYGIEPWNNMACLQGYENPQDPNRKWWAEVDLKKIKDGYYALEKELDLGEQIEILEQKSDVCIEKFRKMHEQGNKIDLLHIDGNHSEKVSVKDVEMYLPLVRSGGIIIFDDMNWETTKKAQGIIFEKTDKLWIYEDAEGKYGVFRKP